MKELVIISGKGGTGKTSIVASFAALALKPALADCDVDAADLHLILEPTVVRREIFSGGSRARIMPERCAACGQCQRLCRFDAIGADGAADGPLAKTFWVDPIACDGCGVCAWFCAEKAIEFGPVANGEWFVSDTRHGPMVHAELGVAEENSGKLVSIVRAEAKRIVAERALELLIVDGSPGIGCPVIASITGADLVLVVTEPTMSGLHDLRRVADLTKHFGIKTMVCINKWDVNEKISGQIEVYSREQGILVAGRIRYDSAVTRAQLERKSIVEYTQTGVAEDVQALWSEVANALIGLRV
ncbi:ATP-binding protein [Candidatus Sumerlaeota bacterium]